jgi:hypothetical protein
MRRSLIAVLVLAAIGTTAAAQPGQTAPAPPPPPQPHPQPYYPPQPAQPAPPAQPPYGQPYGQPYVPPPYQYQLTQDELELLADGEISDGQRFGGGLAAIFFGLGLGQAVQGRWTDTGWIFTLGEVGAFTLIMTGAIQNLCDGDGGCGGDDDDDGETLIVVGAVSYLALRVWGVVDAFSGPSDHNRKVRALRMRLGYPPSPGYYGATPFVAPTRDGDGGVAGITLRF